MGVGSGSDTERVRVMAFFRSRPSSHFVAIHPDNARKRDWIILLEAGTIVGTPRNKLRVAQTTQERKIVKRYSLFRKTQHFMLVDGYDPRIHALYFCPQLYRYDNDKLVPLQGEEISRLIAQSLEGGVPTDDRGTILWTSGPINP